MLLAKRKSDNFPNLVNDLFTNDWDDFWSPVRYNRNTTPAVNISETEHEYNVELAVPGANKKDFNIEIDNGVLTISSEKKSENNEKNDGYTRREFYYETFSKSFELPKGKVKEDKIDAKYEDGILKLHLPKSEEAKVKPSREIKIS